MLTVRMLGELFDLDHLEVRTRDLPGGGWDVDLRIDGTYHGEAPWTRAEIVAYREEVVRAAVREEKEWRAGNTPEGT